MPADNYHLYIENAKWDSTYLSEAGLCWLPVRKFSHWTLLKIRRRNDSILCFKWDFSRTEDNMTNDKLTARWIL